MQAVLDEIIKKTRQVSDEERDELIQVLQQQKNESKKNGGKEIVQPNIKWLKKHRSEYAGNYVALKDGELVAFARRIKEADLKAKERGVEKPLLHYIPARGEEVRGGW